MIYLSFYILLRINQSTNNINEKYELSFTIRAHVTWSLEDQLNCASVKQQDAESAVTDRIGLTPNA